MADTVGTKEIKDALNMVASDDLIEVAKGLEVAAGIEREGIDFYGRQAKKFGGQETGDFFAFLAGQEKEHLAAITELKEALEKQGRWAAPKIPANEKPKIFSKKGWDKDHKDAVTAVLFALWKEKQAQEFYEGLAQRVKNAAVAKFFRGLALFEKGHAEMLGEYVDSSFYTNELIMG